MGLENIKVGDIVTITDRRNAWNDEVTKVTATQITAGGERYLISTGALVGGGSWCTRYARKRDDKIVAMYALPRKAWELSSTMDVMRPAVARLRDTEKLDKIQQLLNQIKELTA